MQYIQAIAEAKKITLKHSVDPEDVAEIMHPHRQREVKILERG